MLHRPHQNHRETDGVSNNAKYNNGAFLPTIMNIIQLAKECPDLTVSIKLSELVEANQLLIQETKRELEQIITDQNTETYPSREKVMEILGVSSATLWRWNKMGYLSPLNVGGKRRYRMSDVKRILGGDTQKGESA